MMIQGKEKQFCIPENLMVVRPRVDMEQQFHHSPIPMEMVGLHNLSGTKSCIQAIHRQCVLSLATSITTEVPPGSVKEYFGMLM
jgi:hypothetical protein